MYFIVQHQIRDPKAMWTAAQASLSSMPSGFTLHHSFPTSNGTHGVCLWEAPSQAALQGFLDGALGVTSVNEYFQVDNKEGVALPSQLAASLAG